MKKLREIVQINEIGDSHYSLNQDYTGKNTSMSHFYTNSGNRIQIHIKNSRLWPHKADVNFSDINGFDMNNSEPRAAHRVFGTIRKAISQHLEAFPETTHITFGSKKEEPSRTKLYHHFARSVDPDYTHHEMDMGTEFSMNVGKLKEEILVTEIGDGHYPYQEESSPMRRAYNFKSDKGTTFRVFIKKHSDRFHELSFTSNIDSENKAGMGINNSEPFTSHKIFGTVKKIADDHLKKNPDIKSISISSTSREPSRTKLYHKFAKSVDPNYEHEESRYCSLFTMKNPYHKGEEK